MLTQKARDALVFTSSSHLGQGDDISATFFLPPFRLLHPPFPGDTCLDHVQRGHELTHPSFPTIFCAVSGMKPTYLSRLTASWCTERHFKWSVAIYLFFFSPRCWEFCQGGGRDHATGWPLPAEGLRGRCFLAAQASSLGVCGEDPRSGANTELPASTSAKVQTYFIFINMLW